MTEHSPQQVAEQYRREGVARDVLRASGVDFTGDRLEQNGTIVTESATQAALRMAELISRQNPTGIELLRQAGIEV